MEKLITYKTIPAQPPLHNFVESFWMVANHTGKEHQIVILPDGRFDIIFSLTDNKYFDATLRGLDTNPGETIIPSSTTMFAASFKLLAIEYLLEEKVDSLLNEGIQLPKGFWNITHDDLIDFDAFCKKLSVKMMASIKPGVDERKKQLFDLIYASEGTLTVKQLSEKVFWSSRQINRYFNQTFGISLKSYCNIVRFKSSLPHLKKGELYPALNFTDQTHFIKEVKKMSGVTPKELAKNKNDRFILLSALSNT